MRRSAIGGTLAVVVLSALGGLGWTLDARRDVDLMVNSASRFLASLPADQRSRASFAFDDEEERLRAHFIPTEVFERRGVTIEEMSPAQREAAHDLLQSGLSQRGYLTVSEIMLPHRIRPHRERSEPRALAVARLRGRLRSGPDRRAPGGGALAGR